MALADNWDSFIRIHGGYPGARDMFEKLMDELLRAENPNKEVHIIKASQGDGGIDVCVHQDEGIDIYQCKFFMGKMTKSRWSNIKNSFESAMKPKNVKVLSWFLCMPREFQKEDISAIQAFKEKRKAIGIKIRFIDGNEIINRMRNSDREHNTDLINTYFTVPINVRIESNHIAKCLTNVLPVKPVTGLIGREEIVTKSLELLRSKGGLVLLKGLGGIGKTAIMKEVCHFVFTDTKNDNYVAWINCGDNLQDDLLGLKDAFKIPIGCDKEEAFYRIIDELKRFSSQLYLFLDNMARIPSQEELGTINALRPNVHVMITSRYNIKGIPCIDIQALALNSAVDLFYGYYEHDQERNYIENVRRIIDSDSVRRHTLLIELLAKAANGYWGTLLDFGNKLDEKGFFNISRIKIDTAHDDNITVEESVSRLYDMSSVSLEQQRIMRLFTIFSPEKTLFGEIVEWAGFDENELEKLIQSGWLSRMETGFVIHQIIRDSILKQKSDMIKLEEYGGLLDCIINTDKYMPQNLTYTNMCERLVIAEDMSRYLETIIARKDVYYKGSDKTNELVLKSATLFQNIATVYQFLGHYRKALYYYQKSLDGFIPILSTDHIVVATDYNNIGRLYYKQGDYCKALEYSQKALDIQNRILDPYHSDIVSENNNIGLIYYAMGDFDKAMDYYKKALMILEHSPNADHLISAFVYDNIGLLYQKKGELDKTLENFNKSLAILEEQLGHNHPETALAYCNLGDFYLNLGIYDKSLDYYEEARLIREKVQNRNHPDYAEIIGKIANVLIIKGEYDNAKSLCEEALLIYKKSLNEENIDVAHMYYYLGTIYCEVLEYAKSIECFRKSICIIGRIQGYKHVDLAIIYSKLAVVYTNKSEYDTALEFYRKASVIREEVLGSEHLETAECYFNIAEIYRIQKDYESAVEYYTKAYSVFFAKLGAYHHMTQTVQLCLRAVSDMISDVIHKK